MKRLYRSRKNRVFLGICGGIGDYFRIDPTFIRLTVIFLCVFTAVLPLVIAYFISALIIPKEAAGHKVRPYRRLYRSKKSRLIAGICGGISELFKWDPTIVRIIFVALLFLTGFVPMTIAYLVGWIIIPEKPRNEKTIEIEVE